MVELSTSRCCQKSLVDGAASASVTSPPFQGRGRLEAADPGLAPLRGYSPELYSLPPPGAQEAGAACPTPILYARLDTPYRPGGWTVRQVVHHLPDSRLNAYVRCKLVGLVKPRRRPTAA